MPAEDTEILEKKLANCAPSLTAAVLSWWNDGLCRDMLDLSQCSVSAIRELPDEVTDLLQSRVTQLRLTDSLDQHDVDPLLPWISRLTALKHLQLPNYRDERLDMQRLRPSSAYKLTVGGNVVREVLAAKNANVYSPDAPPTERVIARLHDEDGTLLFSETAMGYPRLVGPGGKPNWTKLNMEGKFPSGEWIACRHIAIQEILDEQKFDAGLQTPTDGASRASTDETSDSSHYADRQLENMGDVESLEKHVDPFTQDIYMALVNRGPANYVFGHSQLGAVATHLFEVMGSARRKQQPILTIEHFVSLSCKAAETPLGAPRSKLRLSDPNETLMRWEFVVSDPADLQHLTIESFFSKEDIQKYYGQGPTARHTSHLIVAPPNLYQWAKNTQTASTQPASEETRTVVEFLSPAEKSDPGRFQYWLRSGLPLPIASLQEALDGCSTDDQRRQLLAATSENDFPGRFLASERGHLNAFKGHNTLIISACENKNKWLDQTQLKDMLAAISKGDPGRNRAMQNGHSMIIDADNEILLETRERDWLSDKAFRELLSGRNKDGVPARSMAMQGDHEETVRADNRALLYAREKDWLTNTQLKDLLAATRRDNCPARHAALALGNTAAIKADNEILFEARKKGWLDNKWLKTLLAANDAQGVSGFERAERRHIEACKEHGRAVLKAFSEGWLTHGELRACGPSADWLKHNCPVEYMAASMKNRFLLQTTAASSSSTTPSAVARGKTPVDSALNELSDLIPEIIDRYHNAVGEQKAQLAKLVGNMNTALEELHKPQNAVSKFFDNTFKHRKQRRDANIQLISQAVNSINRMFSPPLQEATAPKNQPSQSTSQVRARGTGRSSAKGKVHRS